MLKIRTSDQGKRTRNRLHLKRLPDLHRGMDICNLASVMPKGRTVVPQRYNNTLNRSTKYTSAWH